MRKLLWLATLLICLAALAAGCVQKKRKALDPSAPFGDQVIVGYNESGSPIYGASASDLGGPQQMLAWKARLSIEVASLSNAVMQAADIVKKHGGYVESQSDDSFSGTSIRMRIPAKSFTGALGTLETLGTVTSRRVENEDVTEQYVDTEARLKNKLVLRDRLRGLLDQATEVQDILAIETELNRVQGDIDSMEARIKVLQGRVDYAILDLDIRLKPESPKKILGPLGYLFKGLFWTVEKLFVIRE
ncbi:MAG TPA: hypothetical protein DCM68_08135 [Verrucomicrobia bacterium]|nr:hypothetical protein [Verrucomicrobiota bacterium]